MDAKAAIRWAAFYRGVAWVFGIVGLLLVGLAFALGLDDVLIAARARDLGRLLDPGFTAPPVLVALVGFVVWQFGKTVAFYKTLAEAVDEQMAERFDAQRVKSEILEVLDDRLAEMQTELRQARQQVEEIDAGAATSTGSGSFDFEG